jgi:hypothetical protein
MRGILGACLDHRRESGMHRQPALIVSLRSALVRDPVGHYDLKQYLLLRSVHLKRNRADRLLAEAVVTGGDAPHLVTLLDVYPTTAMVYADAAPDILDLPRTSYQAQSGAIDAGQTAGTG